MILIDITQAIVKNYIFAKLQKQIKQYVHLGSVNPGIPSREIFFFSPIQVLPRWIRNMRLRKANRNVDFDHQSANQTRQVKWNIHEFRRHDSMRSRTAKFYFIFNLTFT